MTHSGQKQTFTGFHVARYRKPFKTKKLKKLLLALVVVFRINPAFSAPIQSGDYGGLLIGVDRQGTLTGYFENSTGNGQFSCIFFIRGTVDNRIAHVKTWFPGDENPKEVIPGTIEAFGDNGRSVIRASLKEEHGGCRNVQPFTREPVSFTLSELGSWESIRVVSAKRAHFYTEPTDDKPRKAYAVLGNPLRVFESKNGMVRAEYVSADKKRTQGWISERDLFRADTILTSNSTSVNPLHFGSEHDKQLPQANFSGIWEWQAKFAINESGIVTHRIALSQVGDHICGCFIREWTHENFYEFKSLDGRVTGIIADINVDSGFSDNGQANYFMKYPFIPEDIMRLKKIKGSLSRAATSWSRSLLKSGFPSDDEMIYDDDYFLKFIAPFSLSACEEEEFDWHGFFESCSAGK